METTDTLEPILFTNIVERRFMENKPSEVLPFVRQVAVLTDKDFQKDFTEVLKYILKSIKCN